MEAFLGNMSVRQAKEWELFAIENPLFEDKIMLQIGMIAQFFASYFVKRKDKQSWEVTDFIPNSSKKEESPKEFSNKILNTLGVGKPTKERVKYSLEDKVAERTSLPKRLKGKQ